MDRHNEMMRLPVHYELGIVLGRTVAEALSVILMM